MNTVVEATDPQSFAQQRLWLLDGLLPIGSAYNVRHVLRLSGNLDTRALEQALNEIVRRHEALRTRFELIDGAPVQLITEADPIALKVEDLSSLPTEQHESTALSQAISEAQTRFDLQRGPLFRVRLLRLSESEHWLLICLHHIVTDGWSTGVMWKELSALYAAFRVGEPSPLVPLPVQYADYAVWQRQWLSGARLESELAYWRQALAELPVLELPADRARPTVATYCGKQIAFELSQALTHELNAFARQQEATLFMVLLAAFQVLLSRYSGQEDFGVGVPIAGRARPELEGLIGFFVNTLVMRARLQGQPSFEEHLRRVRATALQAYEHQELPFEKLVEELNPPRDLSRSPLVQVSFVLQNAPEIELQLPGLNVQRVEGISSETAKFDLGVSFSEAAGRLHGHVEYATDLFDADRIERLAGHFITLLQGIVEHPGARVSELPLLTHAERQQLLVHWNETAREYPRDQCIHHQVEAQVERTPAAIAVVAGTQQLSYAELNARANRLAHYLRGRGVGPDVLVGLCVERSLEMVVGLLGILKAGGAYVPIDPSYPVQRIGFMLADAGVQLVLTQRALGAVLNAAASGTAVQLYSLDAAAVEVERAPEHNPDHRTGPRHLAYLIYTSGSTGTPKAVMIEHRSVLRLVCNTDYIDLGRDDCVAALSNPSFDAATFEVWSALVNGARLALIPREIAIDPATLVAAIRRERISTLFLTTALFNEVMRARPDAFAGMRHVLFGGEAVDPRWVRACLVASAPRRLLHVYGPTETTTFATRYPVSAVPAGARTIPIGRPIANTTAYVLDQHRQPVPIGIAGELYIGGDGLARGYWNRPELTAECFVADPFSAEPARMYRTGDLVRYLSDGNIEFLGRLDHQVKLRGFRIELGEIEAALTRHAQVREALVLLREDVADDKRLVAYVVARQAGLDTSELRAQLKQQLPEYMLPAAFVVLPALPLTPNGKIDRKALPAPARAGADCSTPVVMPRDSIELHLAKLWEDLLQRGKIDVRDNFFELGGHSLLAVQLIDRIERTFDRQLPLDTLWFGGGTIESLASLLRDHSQAVANPELILMKRGTRRPLFVTHTMGGNLFHYYELAQHLDAEQTVYGLQARGVFGGTDPDRSIEAIAAHCIESMRSVQPRGPYLLAGFSSGGVVAFEIAQQLVAAGVQVALLALLDTFAPPANATAHWRRELRSQWRNGLRPRALQEFVYFAILHSLKLDRLRALKKSGEAHRWAHWSYRPKPFPGPIEIFIASESESIGRDDLLGWARWFKGRVRAHRIPGNHGQLVKRPTVELLAARLQAGIDAVAEAPWSPLRDERDKDADARPGCDETVDARPS